MNKTLLFVSAAATLLAVSCTQDKAAAVDAATTPSADTAVVISNRDTAELRAAARRTAQRVADDLGFTETVVITQLVPVYVERAQALADLDEQYATDTTGRYAAQRATNDAADRRVRAVVKEPAKYRTYEAKRGTYYEGTPYSNATISTMREEEAAASASSAPARRSGPSIVKYDKKANGETKIVYSNGTTVKVDKDGDRKTEYSNGTKVKRDADDGKVKMKD